MSYFRSLSVNKKLGILLVLVIFGFVCLSALAYRTIEQVRIGSKSYNEVLQGKDLLADIMPPPLFIVEAYVCTRRLEAESDAAEIQKLITRFDELRDEYTKRIEHYKTKQLAGNETELLRKTNTHAFEFFQVAEKQYLPLVRAGTRDALRPMVTETLTPLYEKHQKAINELVSATEKDVAAEEATAMKEASTRIFMLWTLCVAGVLVIGIAAVFIARGITRPVQELVQVMDAIEKGDYTKKSTYQSKDEIGQLAGAVNNVILSLTQNQRNTAQLAALESSFATIELSLEGIILTANENFLRAVGYTFDEIKGRHHSMFVDEATRQSTEYREFWAKLNRGEHQRGEFQRIAKGGKPIWIQGTYNSILDRDGKPMKVVKYANDITAQVQMKLQVAESAEREKAQAQELRTKVDSILATVNAMAQGDFSQEIPNLGDDSIGQMGKALNQAVASVRNTLQEVRDVAGVVGSAAQELSSASEEIASGAQEQASSLEETAASLEEITATIKQNTDSAQQARQLAGNSKEVAEKGGQVVGSAVDAMAAINQSSKKIADIITAIDEIAFQTNLLALNAAVEAARAGEQGRGFAVVAAEVRNLAQRSATAAKEIKSLIQDSVRKVDNGTELVNRSGQTLNEIVTSVKRVTDIVTEIAAASREQSTGVDQVNKAVAQMDKVTQTNAGQTEELSSTSQALLAHAEQLQSLVSQFNLGKDSHAAPSVASRPASKPKGYAAKPSQDRGRTNRRELVTNGHGKIHDLDLDDTDGSRGGFKEF